MTTAWSRPAAQEPLRWEDANRRYLEGWTEVLRLRLRQRVLWLRRQWRRDPLAEHRAEVISDEQIDALESGSDREAEARFHAEDPEAARIGRTLQVRERDLAARARVLADAGSPPALEVLAGLFQLTDFERCVIALCLAPELAPAFERLYAYVQDDLARGFPTLHLALALFADESGEGERAPRDSFLPGSPLRRYLLIEMEAATKGLRLPERILGFLLGKNLPDERFALIVPPLPLAPCHRELVGRLASWVRDREGWPAINLTGPAGSGKRSVARALCQALGMQLYEIDARGMAAGDAGLIRRLEREAVLLQTGFYLEIPETGFAGDLIERLGGFLIVGSRDPWPAVSRALLAIPVPRPDAASQQALWHQALGPGSEALGEALGETIEGVVQQFDFGPRTVVRAAASARARAELRGEGAVTADDLWAACREQSGMDMEALAQRLEPAYGWDDIVVPPEILRQLREIAAQVAHRPRVYESWGFGARLPRGRGISVLFSGPSGTGKTMAAEVFARELRLDLYRIDLAGVVSKYIGETERNLKKVFEAADQSGAILFFDEADALFGKRTDIKDSHDRYANIEVNYLLQRMEDYRGLAILATNRRTALDRAFLRRLRFLVEFPSPDAAFRRRIWQKVYPPATPVEALDWDALSRLEVPGGNIRNIALNAAFLAAEEGRAVTMDHLMRAARSEYAKCDKSVTQAEFGAWYRPGAKR